MSNKIPVISIGGISRTSFQESEADSVRILQVFLLGSLREAPKSNL